jgi:hypothetical protein
MGGRQVTCHPQPYYPLQSAITKKLGSPDPQLGKTSLVAVEYQAIAQLLRIQSKLNFKSHPLKLLLKKCQLAITRQKVMLKKIL